MKIDQTLQEKRRLEVTVIKTIKKRNLRNKQCNRNTKAPVNCGKSSNIREEKDEENIFK